MDSSATFNQGRATFCIVSFGFALGLLWGISMFIMGLLSLYCSYGTPFVELFGSVYLGYKSTLLGSVIGGAWGLADGFVGGAIFAWLYNCCVKCCAKCCAKCCGKFCKKEA